MSKDFQFEILKIAIAALEHKHSEFVIKRELGFTDEELDELYNQARNELDKL